MNLATPTSPRSDFPVIRRMPTSVTRSVREREVFTNFRKFAPADVAALRRDHIRQLPDHQLVELIRTVREQHLPAQLSDRLAFLDRETLLRLTFATQRYLRNLGY